MYILWNKEKAFPTAQEMKPIKGLRFVDVHTAIPGQYQFLLGCAVKEFCGTLYASWGNSYRFENDDNTICAQMTSADGGLTWQDYQRITRKDEGFGRSHGVYCAHNDTLYYFCPKARFKKIDGYPELKTEGYVLTENGFECMGIVLEDDFWPMCEPIKTDEGTLLMAGLETDHAQAAVALCDGKDLRHWRMTVLPNPHNYKYWGETTVLKLKDKLLAIVRGGDDVPYALVSESFDNGRTWSGLQQSNLPISNSKMYAGTLSNGRNYLLFNAPSENYRETLCIALGDTTFDEIYLLRHGYASPPKYWMNSEWCYPYACEANGNLYVVYARNKEDCELAILPIESLS